MSLYETAIALGLKCRVVPVSSKPEYDHDEGGKVDMFAPGRFGPLLTGERGEYSEGGDWGRPMPQGRYTWVNPQTKDLNEAQTAYVVFGNDLGSLDVTYSGAAMLIRIPPFRERHLPADESENFWAGIKRNDGVYDFEDETDFNDEDQEEFEEIEDDEDDDEEWVTGENDGGERVEQDGKDEGMEPAEEKNGAKN